MGPSTVPWGTPEVTAIFSDVVFSKSTVYNMMEHVESNNILYEMQHGFRSNRSCESQIISLAHQLAQNNDKNIQTDLIIMDFAKPIRSKTMLHFVQDVV
jgi:hypothetical protein